MATTDAEQSFDYIRRYYGVPAEAGPERQGVSLNTLCVALLAGGLRFKSVDEIAALMGHLSGPRRDELLRLYRVREHLNGGNVDAALNVIEEELNDYDDE